MSPEYGGEPLIQATPEERLYDPYGAAYAMWHCRDFIVVQAGGAGTGKTRANLEALHACMLRFPGARGLLLRKNRSALTETGLVTFEEDVLPVNSPICKGQERKGRHSYRYPNKSEIICGGMANSGDEIQKVMSSQYDIAVMMEMTEFEEDDLLKVITRMRNFKCQRKDGTYLRQILGDCNPSGPTHWIKRWGDAKKLNLLESRHEDNPAYYDHEKKDWTPRGKVYIADLDALPGVAYQRLRLGKWVQAEGVVYPEFDRNVHLIDRFEIPSSWRRVRVIDFGYTNPFVCLWIAIDHDGRMFVYRELYMTQRTVRVHGEKIRELSAGESIDYTVADHDPENRASLRELGIPTVNARKNVSWGLQAVHERLKLRPDALGEMSPRLFIMKDILVEADQSLLDKKRPVCLEQEFEFYVNVKDQQGRPQKEEPVKEHDHSLDALRYACMSIDYQKPPVEPDTPEVVVAKEERKQLDKAERQAQYLQKYGWSSF